LLLDECRSSSLWGECGKLPADFPLEALLAHRPALDRAKGRYGYDRKQPDQDRYEEWELSS
jgi:hypothetical protein